MSVVIAVAVPHPPLIVSGVGHGREREIQPTVDAYREVARRIAALRPDTIVVSSPHTAMYLDYLHIAPGPGARGTFARFGDPAAGAACCSRTSTASTPSTISCALPRARAASHSRRTASR